MNYIVMSERGNKLSEFKTHLGPEILANINDQLPYLAEIQMKGIEFITEKAWRKLIQ